MDVINLNASTHDFGNINEPERNPLLLLAEVSTSQLSPLGYTVQTLNLTHSGHLDQQTSQDRNSCPLNHFSISNSPLTESELMLVKWLSKNTQQQVPTEAVKFQVTDSLGVGGPTHLALEDGYVSSKTSQTADITSNKNKASHISKQAKYARTDKGKAARARYNASDKGKASHDKKQAKYARTDKGRAARARYNASDKGRAAKAKYLAKYNMSDIRKIRKAVSYTKWYTYQAALKKGYSEKLARNKGELAAKNKMAKLSFTSSKTTSYNAE